MLGRPFLENYYSGFDLENNKFALTNFKSHTTPSSDDSSTIVIVIVVILLIAGLGVGAFIWYRKRSSPDTDARQVYKEVADKNESH